MCYIVYQREGVYHDLSVKAQKLVWAGDFAAAAAIWEKVKGKPVPELPNPGDKLERFPWFAYNLSYSIGCHIPDAAKYWAWFYNQEDTYSEKAHKRLCYKLSKEVGGIYDFYYEY